MCPVFRTRYRNVPSPEPTSVKIGTVKAVQDSPMTGNPDLYPGKESQIQDVNVQTGGYPSYSEKTSDQKNEGPPYLTGGTFGSLKAYIPDYAIRGDGHYESPPWSLALPGSDRWGHVVYDGGWSQPNFSGDVIALSTYANLDTAQSNSSLWPSLTSLASGGYARLRPRIEGAGLGVAIGELRDLPRMLSTTASVFHQSWRDLGGITTSDRMLPKEAADQFLNTQFGWVPFLRDLEQMGNLSDKLFDYMSQVRRDNGQWVKRFRRNQTVTSETPLGFFPGTRCVPATGLLFQTLFTNNPTSDLTLIDKTDVWYEGVFKYYRPEFDISKTEHETGLSHQFSALRRLSTLYGIRLNPSVVWKLTPWSWLVDWFGNVGNAIQRHTDAAYDGVVSKYMYLMHHHMREVRLRQVLYLHSGALALEWSRMFDLKRRVKADSPYGFSLNQNSLNSGQLAILAALGIARQY